VSKHENLKSDVYGERIQARYFIAERKLMNASGWLTLYHF